MRINKAAKAGVLAMTVLFAVGTVSTTATSATAAPTNKAILKSKAIL